MKKNLLMLLLLMPIITFSQSPFKAFENLIGGRWVTKGKWAMGKEFHQEKEHTWELTKRIMVVKTYDFIDATKFDQSLRNYGIRAYDSLKNQINFYEFNAFNSMVNGKCRTEGNDIYFEYDYEMGNGKSMRLTDSWKFVDKDKYEYRVGVYKDGKWEQVYLSTIYNRKM